MIQNREPFLQTIAKQLGRSTPSFVKPVRNWKHLPQHEVLKEASADELVAILTEQCTHIHTHITSCTQLSLQTALQEVIEALGNGLIVYNDDRRFKALQLEDFLAKKQSRKWDLLNREKSIELTERANIGLVISDVTLAESGTIMLQSEAKKGRSISFLPENSIAIIPKSTLVPRMTQAAQFLRNQNHLASCINFITGPSNSADIEMNLVVGVHGPVRMTYLLVEDY